MTDTLVWISVRHGRSFSYHDRPDCMDRYKNNIGAIPTLLSYLEPLGFHRCVICARAANIAARREVIVALHEQGLSFSAIALRLAARFDISRTLAHKDYQRAKRGA